MIKEKILLSIIIILVCFQSASTGQESEIKYRIIFIIHGDGDYAFHDTDGNKYYADEIILNKAINLAGKSFNGEVFIFHQKKKENFLFFFPTDDGNFYHYKNGKKVSDGSYSREEANGWEEEVKILAEHTSKKSKEKIYNILLYYGHEIPSENFSNYHSSHLDKEFSIYTIKEDLNKISDNFSTKKFDLLVLSTCNNGSFKTISALSSVSDYIIASPSDLHLSMMNPDFLVTLESNNWQNLYDFSYDFSNKIFSDLISKTNTIVEISLYETSKAVQNFTKGNPLTDTGVKTFYRPPLFGKEKEKQKHSGWLTEEQ